MLRRDFLKKENWPYTNLAQSLLRQVGELTQAGIENLPLFRTQSREIIVFRLGSGLVDVSNSLNIGKRDQFSF